MALRTQHHFYGIPAKNGEPQTNPNLKSFCKINALKNNFQKNFEIFHKSERYKKIKTKKLFEVERNERGTSKCSEQWHSEMEFQQCLR